jgi:C1A family cysteine protease
MTDHRNRQSPVRHQGDRPTCVAFAVSGGHEWMADEQAHRSAEDALWAGHQVLHVPGREETSIAAALQGLATHQHATETSWPYGEPGYPAERPAAALEATNRRALPPWRALPSTDIETIAAQLERPAAVMLTVKFVYGAWHSVDGIIDASGGAKSITNHAVLAVGVSDAPVSVIIKNSWGARWGENGYGYITERYLRSYALRAHILEPA